MLAVRLLCHAHWMLYCYWQYQLLRKPSEISRSGNPGSFSASGFTVSHKISTNFLIAKKFAGIQGEFLRLTGSQRVSYLAGIALHDLTYSSS